MQLHLTLESYTSSSLSKIQQLEIDKIPKHILELIVEGKTSVAYHGTNKDFDQFEISSSKDWRANKFYGHGIYLTPSKILATKYANAEANKELPLSIIERVKEIDLNLFKFMNSLYYRGNITWNLPEIRKILEHWNYQIDPNDVAELVNLIPGSQSQKDYDADNKSDSEFVNIFATTTSALTDYQIEWLKELGLGDFSPRILTVKIQGSSSVFVSNNPEQIRKSDADIVIIYDVPYLIDDIPEICIRNEKIIKIIQTEFL